MALESPRREPTARLAALYWPPDEFDRLLSRWPAMAEDYGDQHAEHRALLERTLRELSAEGTSASVAAGTVDGYIDFAAAQDEDPADRSTRADYAAHLGVNGLTAAWPPGRNEPCWCGSARKYKKCCGTPGFAAPSSEHLGDHEDDQG